MAVWDAHVRDTRPDLHKGREVGATLQTGNETTEEYQPEDEQDPRYRTPEWDPLTQEELDTVAHVRAALGEKYSRTAFSSLIFAYRATGSSSRSHGTA